VASDARRDTKSWRGSLSVLCRLCLYWVDTYLEDEGRRVTPLEEGVQWQAISTRARRHNSWLR
jgi:hypothetical protein